ncbi:hypothetical protein K438DRAFT_1991291 [Mycena galopus ATCC 62051]|nr:hypothetical protein K438DRAFT_1991291 [Mycena galopus ATCC 62051]
MSSLPATIIKAGHTYKTIDHQYCLPGNEPIHSAMYSISFPLLREVFEQMQTELRRHGHSQTQLMYTNNPRAERKFHESVNPSFCENVQHIVPEPFNNLPPFKPASTPINYFSSQTAIDSACDGIIEALASLPLTESLVISLVIKCTAATLDIIQVPACLFTILTNKCIVKIGPQMRQSMQSISAAWSMPSSSFMDSSSVIDLSHVAKVKGTVSNATSSLPTLAGTVLKQSLPDFSYISAHDWSREITEDDVNKLGQEPITLVIGKTPLAEGELVAHDGLWPSPSDSTMQMKITTASTVGHYNHTGKKWRGHYDIWLLDDLVEKALNLGIEPSIPTPKLLATRIATSE